MGDDDFKSFLLHEYDNMAQAHFKMVETISAFFKNYLTIISIPTALVFIVLNLPGLQSNPVEITSENALAFGFLFLGIAFIGILLLWHVANLRMDALLYARTINGIRKYYFDNDHETSLSEKLYIRVLPQSPFSPQYNELKYFGPVVGVFALIDTFYLMLALTSFGLTFGCFSSVHEGLGDYRVFGIAFLFGLVHLGGYIYLANYREHAYLRSNIIGVDIDGVLNKHRDHFSKMVGELCAIEINPQEILEIPVRNCESLGVSKHDEYKVFNNPDYWTKMPVDPDAGPILSNLRNLFNLKVSIFTARPWPILQDMGRNEELRIMNDWIEGTGYMFRSIKGAKGKIQYYAIKLDLIIFSWLLKHVPWCREFTYSFIDPIKLITTKWLDANSIPYDKLMIEKASEHVMDSRSVVRNRFQKARTKQYRYFVEDDYVKALKLSYICDVVFLINHPYNSRREIPSNVIRVNDWEELYERVKELA